MTNPVGDKPISTPCPEPDETAEDAVDLAAAEAALARIAAGAKPIPWDEVKRRAGEVRRTAGHHVRPEAEHAEAQRRLDDKVRGWRSAEVRRKRRR